MTRCHRMWINQPSTLQGLHRHHGQNVTMLPTPEKHSNCCTVYPVDGTIISMVVPVTCLSEGWI